MRKENIERVTRQGVPRWELILYIAVFAIIFGVSFGLTFYYQSAL